MSKWSFKPPTGRGRYWAATYSRASSARWGIAAGWTVQIADVFGPISPKEGLLAAGLAPCAMPLSTFKNRVVWWSEPIVPPPPPAFAPASRQGKKKK